MLRASSGLHLMAMCKRGRAGRVQGANGVNVMKVRPSEDGCLLLEGANERRRRPCACSGYFRQIMERCREGIRRLKEQAGSTKQMGRCILTGM